MQETILSKSWIFTAIEGVREMEELSTYYCFEYAKLPPIEIELDDEFNWLKPYPKYSNEEELDYNFKKKLGILEQDAKSKGLIIPKCFMKFMSQISLLKRIRSNTDCYFELGDFIEEIPNTNGLHFLHFLSDSQYCMLWYLCLDKEGNHCIVASGNVYGHKEGDMEEEDEMEEGDGKDIDYYCSPTFNDFIFRFWIENEICFKGYDEFELNDIEKRYVQYYLDNKK